MLPAHVGREPDQDNSRIIDLAYECEPAEVLVFSEQDALLRVSHFHQLPINGPLLKFADREDVVPG